MSGLNFDALRDLHNSANDLLHSQVMKQEIASNGQEKLVHEVSEASLRMLEVCGTTKDVVLRVKDHLYDLQSTFRRISVGEIKTSYVENKLEVYRCDRKKLRKDMVRRMNSLKGMMSTRKNNNNTCLTVASPLTNRDALVTVVNVLREVRATTISMVESLMSLMSMPCPNNNRKAAAAAASFAAKLKRVNSLSWWEKCDAMTLQCAGKRLAAVEMAVGDLEGELECIIRRLIRTRVSLLNILTTN